MQGIASVVRDQDIIDSLWSDFAKAWFELGKDDPTLTLIKVIPENSHYWDTKDGKLMAKVKIILSTIIGSKADGGREGELTV